MWLLSLGSCLCRCSDSQQGDDQSDECDSGADSERGRVAVDGGDPYRMRCRLRAGASVGGSQTAELALGGVDGDGRKYRQSERAVARGEMPPGRDLDLLARLFPALALQQLVITGELPGTAFAVQIMDDVVYPLATALAARK